MPYGALIEGKRNYTVVFIGRPLMFELAADKLAQDIKAVTYSLDDFCKFGDEVLELPFPFVGKIPWPRFTMVSTTETEKVRRKEKPRRRHHRRSWPRQGFENRAVPILRARGL